MEPISPELALVDPELAQRARALLQAPGSLDLQPRDKEAVQRSPPARAPAHRDALIRVAAWLAVPSIALNIALLRTDSGKESSPSSTLPQVAAASSNGSLGPATTRGLRARAGRPVRPTRPKAEGVEAAQYELNRRRPRVARKLVRWPATANAAAYDLVVWRGRRRVADVWTTKPKIRVTALACRGQRRLEPGRYLWFVYPLLDSQPRRYGHLTKWGRFSVAVRACS